MLSDRRAFYNEVAEAVRAGISSDDVRAQQALEFLLNEIGVLQGQLDRITDYLNPV